MTAGPLRTLPVVEYTDPWQGHGKVLFARQYPMVHPAWVQVEFRAAKTLLPLFATIMPETTTYPPDVLRAELDGAVRSKVKVLLLLPVL